MNNLDSYPPPFRPQNNQTHNPDPYNPSSDPNEYPDPVPIIDLRCLKRNPDEQKKLEEACKDWGLFRLANHDIPLNLLNQLQDLARDLFSISFESKQALTSDSPVSYFWGTAALTPKGTALARGPQSINWLEGFNIPLSQLSGFDHQVPLLDSFRVLLEEYGNHLSRIARTLYETMAKNLDLDPETSKSFLSEETGIFRVYRYPANPNADAALGMEVHTDSSVLSILHQNDGVNGLEVLRDDQWQTVKSIPNSLIVNLGDMMQAISDDTFKSVKQSEG
ncbi:hypothetical protein L6164_026673 [Bauhinia variegata]|uniref:Uncharacterized protein n=1 Tax=Bauhinia variegata TaxID=167791 RepID=A0ACB9LRG0_BAUVA|nr:hypothetical protein L6164_026673 [Bauhinia variegata]